MDTAALAIFIILSIILLIFTAMKYKKGESDVVVPWIIIMSTICASFNLYYYSIYAKENIDLVDIDMNDETDKNGKNDKNDKVTVNVEELKDDSDGVSFEVTPMVWFHIDLALTALIPFGFLVYFAQIKVSDDKLKKYKYWGTVTSGIVFLFVIITIILGNVGYKKVTWVFLVIMLIVKSGLSAVFLVSMITQTDEKIHGMHHDVKFSDRGHSRGNALDSALDSAPTYNILDGGIEKMRGRRDNDHVDSNALDRGLDNGAKILG